METMKSPLRDNYVTPREIEVWTMVAQGLPNKRIAYLLGITAKGQTPDAVAIEAVRRGVIAVEVRPLTREAGPRGKERWRL